MTWTEPACLATVVGIATATAVYHCRREKAGEMGWNTVEWKDLVRDRSGSSAVIAALRLSMFSYIVFTVCWTVLLDEPSWGILFCTLSGWSWLLMGVYFGAAGVASTLDAVGVKPREATGGLAARVMWALFESLFGCAVLIFWLVWLVFVPSEYFADGSISRYFGWRVLSLHNLNVVFMAVDFARNGFGFRYPHVVFAIYYGEAYFVFSVIWFLHRGFFYYPSFDWRKWIAPVCYFGLVGITCVVFRVIACVGSRLKPAGPAKAAATTGGGAEIPEAAIGAPEPGGEPP